MPIQDNLGLLNKPRGQGFSKERMDLFWHIIKKIQEISIGEDRSANLDEILPNHPRSKGRKAVEKAIEFIAVPEGICIVPDLILNDAWCTINSPDEYGAYIRMLSDEEIRIDKNKKLASAAWMNGTKNL